VGYHAGKPIESVVYCFKNQKISHCLGYKFSTYSSYIRVLRLSISPDEVTESMFRVDLTLSLAGKDLS